MRTKFLLRIFFCTLLLQSCSYRGVQYKGGFGFPKIIAHRGGQLEAPENTLYAFKKAMEAGVDGIELDVQLSKDGIPMLYHPIDLKEKTNGSGALNTWNAADLRQLNAGYQFLSQNGYCFRNTGEIDTHMPTLEEALKFIPKRYFVIIDLKSLLTKPLIDAVFKVVNEDQDWDRVLFYSTSMAHSDLLKNEPRANSFEPRDDTRARLLSMLLNSDCLPASRKFLWSGFELRRKMTVSEQFQLGTGQTQIDIRQLWNKKSLLCMRGSNSKAKVVLFGINTEADAGIAMDLAVDAIYTDCPQKMIKIKAKIGR